MRWERSRFAVPTLWQPEKTSQTTIPSAERWCSVTASRRTTSSPDRSVTLNPVSTTSVQGSLGRFLSPDPSNLDYADQTNPQSLNLYSYALNNPLKFIDPTGMYCFYGGKGDTPENDSDPTDYDFTDEKRDCHGQWIDNPSTILTVNGNTGESDSITTFPTDTNAIVQRSFTRKFPCNQNASSTIGDLESNFPKNADWQKGPLHVTFLQRGQLQTGWGDPD
jgi:RHS repeat-associated protein